MPFYAVNPSNGQIMQITDEVILLSVDPAEAPAGPEGAVNDYLLGEEYTEQGFVAFHGQFVPQNDAHLAIRGAADDELHTVSGF